MSHILITGGAGFVGSTLAVGLKERHPAWSITALDNLKRRGSELNLSRLQARAVQFRHGDIRNAEDVMIDEAVDVIIECSAEPSVLAGYGESPEYLVNTNLGGTLRCLELARNRKAAFLFLSTSRVYPIETLTRLRYREGATRFVLEEDQPVPGASAKGVSEDFPLQGTRSLYGATKLCSEYVMQEYLAMYELQGVINRCGAIAGPWQMARPDQGFIGLWAARHLYGGELNYIGYQGSGKQVRDVLHIEDLLDLIDYELAHLEALNGQIFNVGGGNEVSLSLLELTSLCEEISGNALPVGRKPEPRPADIPIFMSDHRRLTAATGWQPRRDAGTILADIFSWLKDNEDQVKPILAG